MSSRPRVRSVVLAVAVSAVAAGVGVSHAAPPPDSAGAPHYFAAKTRHTASTTGGAQTKSPYPDMSYHRGPVLPSATVQPVYWGVTWPAYAGDKISGLATFYQGYSGSLYAQRSDEYADSHGHVGPTVAYQQERVDGTTAAPTTAPTVSQVLAEVAKNVTPDPTGHGYYPVYADTPRPVNANFCAWHSYGTINGTTVQIAFFWNLDGDTGCDNHEVGTVHTQGLAALANVSAHELSEARTDPLVNAWYDRNRDENADKCAWTFGQTTTNPLQLSTLSNGTQWKLQGEWSNAAYDAQTGYPNTDKQNGCLAGY